MSPLPDMLTVTSTSLQDTVVLVTASGEIDLAGAPILADALADVLRPPTPRVVLVDLGEVSFLDSSGINALIDAHHQAQTSSAHLRICGANQAVSSPLEIMGMTDYLEIYDNRTAALADTVLG
jgi:stage II sporulation protein AA (anti-sigma F factor antagonist)